jgi:hypothetical protein
MTNIWDKAEIQTHKEIQTFDDIIRPKLLSYYKTTGEDIYINLNEYGTHTLPIVFYTDNYDLGYKIQEVRTTDLHDREYITDKEVEVTDIRYSDPLNIKVIRVFLCLAAQIFVTASSSDLP